MPASTSNAPPNCAGDSASSSSSRGEQPDQRYQQRQRRNPPGFIAPQQVPHTE